MIKNMLFRIKDLFVKTLHSFPLANISLFLLTFLMVFEIDDMRNLIINSLYCFIATFGIGAYCIETKKLKNIFYLVPFLIATFFSIAILVEPSITVAEVFNKLLVTYLISTTIFCLYTNYKNSQKEFEIYLEDIFKGFIKLTFTYGVFALSILGIMLLFDFLIVDIDGDIIIKTQIIIFTLYYISNLLYTLKGEDNSESTIIKALIRKILTPLAYVAIIIIYIFIIKAIITDDVLDKTIFYIITGLLATVIPTILMASSYKENTAIDKINKYITFSFIPFIIVQAYVILNEIAYFGIEPEIYIGIMIVIFEICYLLCNIFKKDYGNLFITAITIVIVSIIVPFINAEDLSLHSQYNNLKIYTQNSTYTEKQKSKIYNAYNYLKWEDEKLNLTEEDIEIIKKFNKNSEEYEQAMREYISASYSGTINIEGYKQLYVIDAYDYSIENEIDKITIAYEDNELKIDFRNQFMNYYNNQKDIDNYFESNNEIIVDENYKIILTNFHTSYIDQEIISYSINGYLLVK